MSTERRQARERALGLLYEAETKSQSPSALVAEQVLDPDPFAVDVVNGVEANQGEIDALITRFAENWPLARMPALDRTLLRMGVYELTHRPDVPTGVVLSEIVDLASEYSTDDSGPFVNGVLAAIAAEVRTDGDTEAAPPLADGTVALRPWCVEDAPVLARAWADPAVRRWSAVPAEATVAGAERWIAGADGCRQDGLALDLAIETEDGVVGEVGLGPIQWGHRRAAVGFWIDAEHRRNSLAARALKLLAAWALTELPLDTLAAEASSENPASGWTLAAAGFTLATERPPKQAWIRRS